MFNNSIDIAMLLENEFFSQGQITAFGLINFIPDYINVDACVDVKKTWSGNNQATTHKPHPM